METNPGLNLEDFLAAPLEEVARVAPATMIYSVSGTRRSAALAGVPTQGKAYVRWSREQMVTCVDVIFRHGIRHILMPLITPSQFNELTPAYRRHLWDWLDWGMAGPDALADYQRFGWRVRLAFSERLQHLRQAGQRLLTETAAQSDRTLWIFVIPQHNVLWQWTLATLRQSPAGTPAEASRLLYGQEIPPATLYLDFGKPIVSPDLLPPFLIGNLQCYWSQQPGYSLDEPQFRTILYDYAYLRPTWQADKTGRAQQALAYRATWEQSPIVGLGLRLGPFWHPASEPVDSQ